MFWHKIPPLTIYHSAFQLNKVDSVCTHQSPLSVCGLGIAAFLKIEHHWPIYLQGSHKAIIHFLIKVISQKWSLSHLSLANSSPWCQEGIYSVFIDLRVKSKGKCASSAAGKQKKGQRSLKFGSLISPHYFRPCWLNKVVQCYLCNIFSFVFLFHFWSALVLKGLVFISVITSVFFIWPCAKK